MNGEAGYGPLYFSDPTPLIDRMKDDLGLAGYQTFIANKEAAQAIPLYKAKREEESQRKVAAGILYDLGNGMYGVIPPALGKGNQTLKRRPSALRRYEDSFKFKQSPETLASITSR